MPGKNKKVQLHSTLPPKKLSYPETINYLYQKLPVFQRVGKAAYKADLNNTIDLCRNLNDPHKQFLSIHVAGTNGKGSVSHMLASVLQEAGYKTGLYTSPHLKDFRERIRINGEMMSESGVIDLVQQLKPDIERIQPSFFEITVVMAFKYFADNDVDIAIIETGMGGRLDSTNVITPILSIITNIGMDHNEFLGDNYGQIAAEKAGIIKTHIPVIIGERHPATVAVFDQISDQKQAEISYAEDYYKVDIGKNENGKYFNIFKQKDWFLVNVLLDLHGDYQSRNVPAVLKALEKLNNSGFKISEAAIIRGLANVIKNTGLMGRWQKLSDKPLVICDVGHNVDGIRFIVSQLRQMAYKKLHIVFGLVKEKNVQTILKLMPTDAQYYFCQANLPRALEVETLEQEAMKAGLSGKTFSSVISAYQEALIQAGENDLIFVGGSTFVVAEVL